jgi:integrator complex subunit 11
VHASRPGSRCVTAMAAQWPRRGPPPPPEHLLSLLPLGSGQHVGKSCLLLTIGGKRVLLDCGVHPGRNDDQRYPDFSLLGPAADLTAALDVVIVSHFHLDHIGALPYLTETLGYRGPIVMTHPTKAIAPMLLRDYRKVSVGRRRQVGGEADESAMAIHTDSQVGESLARATGIGLHETMHVGGVELTAYYAGHVLGAAMFHVRVGGQSVLYTGDFSTVADHHLRAAWVPRLCPTLLISEGTYATAPRAWKRGREHELLEGIRKTVSNGGKVLIPVFAVGRAQELCLLLNTYWEQTGLGSSVPILFAEGMAEQATEYYRLFSHWTNTDLQQATSGGGGPTGAGNLFDFQHIGIFRKEEHWARVLSKDQEHAMVLFATPAMLSGGLALDVFKEW